MLPAAEQVLQQLEEEARASWEDRAVFYATQVTNLAGRAFEALNENRWSRRDCMEYQDELDWVMRTFQWICDELDLSDMAAKIGSKRKASNSRIRPICIRYCNVPPCFNGFSTLCPVCRPPFLHFIFMLCYSSKNLHLNINAQRL